MKKIMLLAATAAMTLAFAACSDCDDCTSLPKVVQTNTASGVQNALDQGASDITLTETLKDDATFTIPKRYASNQTVTLNIPAAGHDVVINEGTGNAGSLPVLHANVPNAEDVTINTPNMSVNFGGTVEGTLTASTAANTLTILKAATVNKLVVSKGNVYVFGTVASYGTIASGSKVVRAVSTAEDLVAKLAETTPQNGGAVLTANINLTNVSINAPFIIGTEAAKTDPATAFNPTSFDGYIFDGNGYTLGGAGFHNVLLVCANDVVIKNLTINQTAAEKASAQTANRGNNALTVYRSKGVVLENVTVEGTDKAGLIVSSSVVTASGLTAKGNAWGSVNLTEGINPPGGGDPEFTFNSGNLEGADVATSTGPYKIWVDLNTLTTPTAFKVTFPAGSTWDNALNPSNSNQKFFYPAK